MDDVHYLALAYIIGLVVLFAYLFFLDRHQRKLSKELGHLESLVKQCKPVLAGPWKEEKDHGDK